MFEYTDPHPTNAKGHGRVTLVGAGPGDVDLLTLKAVKASPSSVPSLQRRLTTPDLVAVYRRRPVQVKLGTAGAALDAGVDGAILQRLEGACDHPTTLVFPEGEYLKGLAVLRQ